MVFNFPVCLFQYSRNSLFKTMLLYVMSLQFYIFCLITLVENDQYIFSLFNNKADWINLPDIWKKKCLQCFNLNVKVINVNINLGNRFWFCFHCRRIKHCISHSSQNLLFQYFRYFFFILFYLCFLKRYTQFWRH